MTEKLRRGGVVVAALAGTYMGLLMLYWVLLNLRLYTAALVSSLEIAGLTVLLIFLLIIFANTTPAAVLRRLKVKTVWPYLATGIPSAALLLLAFAVLLDIEFTLGAILPKGPGGVDMPTLMVISPTDFIRRIAHTFASPERPSAPDVLSYLIASAVFSPVFMIGSGLYWFFRVRRAVKRERIA